MGHSNPSPRKPTNFPELSVRSASWTTVIVPSSTYYWRNSPQSSCHWVLLGPTLKDLDLWPTNSPFHPRPFSLKYGLVQPQALWVEFLVEFLILWTTECWDSRYGSLHLFCCRLFCFSGCWEWCLLSKHCANYIPIPGPGTFIKVIVNSELAV